MTESKQLSQQAFDRLKAEHDDLTSRGRIEIAKKIESARELGDLSENGDYHAAKEEQGKMEARIAQLAALIEDAEIVTPDADATAVATGHKVTIIYEGDDEPETYLIGSIEEASAEYAVMSPGSPLGKLLIGAAVGDSVTFESPAGPVQVKVTKIEV